MADIPLSRCRVHRRRAGDLLHPEREPMAVLGALHRTLGSLSEPV